ncbi:TFIIH/NER complex subunit [Elasticomyces elasticus]|nr:TFIIH/NER complex subunit [Elasticomyces elasticus]
MPRLTQARAVPAPVEAPLGNKDVCKSQRYLNKSMRFLINPECYHKMCSACVDRIFSFGPARCPVAGCTRTLRKNKFREQTFDDIRVEEEVDIRRRVAAVFNRREEEFETLLAYNDYLNDVEDITYNLINKVDVVATNAKLEAYRTANSQSIDANKSIASREAQDHAAQQVAEKDQARMRREAARREDEEERRALVEGRQDVLNKLAHGGGDAEEIAKESHKVTLKKRLDRRAAAERQRQLQSTEATTNGESNGLSGVLIKGLKTKKDDEPEAPFDPFGGLTIELSYTTVQDHYDWDWLNVQRKDVQYTAGGYDFQEFHSRALCEAFSGLGVFIGEEMAAGDGSSDITTAAAAGAATGSKDTAMYDAL